MTIQVLGTGLRHDPQKSYGDEITGANGLGLVWSKIPRPKSEWIGRNVAIYHHDGNLFVGVECSDENYQVAGLERRTITIHDHILYIQKGPYSKFPDSYDQITNVFKTNAWEWGYPFMEIYGHWEEDESKLIVEILIPFSKKTTE